MQQGLELTLRKEADEVTVRVVLMQRTGVMHRIAFLPARLVEETFDEEFSEELVKLLDQIGDTPGASSFDYWNLQSLSLTMASCSAIVSEISPNTTQYIIRVADAGGRITGVFKPDVLDTGPKEGRSEQISLQALERFYLPIANFNYQLEQALDGQSGSGEQMQAALEALKAQSELLEFAFQRILSEMKSGDLDGQTARISSDLVRFPRK